MSDRTFDYPVIVPFTAAVQFCRHFHCSLGTCREIHRIGDIHLSCHFDGVLIRPYICESPAFFPLAGCQILVVTTSTRDDANGPEHLF